MGLWKFIGVSPLLLVGGHSAFVVYHENSVAKTATSADTAVDYRPGSTNDMMLDNMHSGDVVLFRRKWFYHHLPVALSILLYRGITQSEFDHLGVVIVDKRGNPWIVENTPFEGMKSRKLADRLKANDSEIVAMLPLLPRPEKSATFGDVEDWANKFSEQPSEVDAFMKFSSSILAQQLFGRNPAVPIEARAATTAGLCPNTLLLKQNLDVLGIRVKFMVDTENSYATLRSIEDRLVSLKYKDQLNKTKLSFSPDYILLQTR